MKSTTSLEFVSHVRCNRLVSTMNIFEAIDPNAKSHVVSLRNSAAGSPLFCFPGSGGNVHIFRDLVAALPRWQSAYGIDMEWLCSVTSDFTVEEIAAFYLKVIRHVQKNGPYRLCGYSFGGLVAYEIARLLTDEGDSANLVALLDAPNPALIANLSASQSAEFRRQYLADRLRRYARDLLRGDFKAIIDRGFAFVVSRFGRPLLPLIKFGIRLFGKPIPAAIRANDPGFLRAWRAYVPRSYPKQIICFRIQERGPEHDHDPTMGWNACVTGGVEVHVVAGGHVNMMKMPSVGAIAENLVSHLDLETEPQRNLSSVRVNSARA
jgi:thioesterase domain-containing protein